MQVAITLTGCELLSSTARLKTLHKWHVRYKIMYQNTSDRDVRWQCRLAARHRRLQAGCPCRRRYLHRRTGLHRKDEQHFSTNPPNPRELGIPCEREAGKNLNSHDSLAIHLFYESTTILKSTSHCHFPRPTHSTTATWLGCLRQVHSRFTTTATRLLLRRRSAWTFMRTWKSLASRPSFNRQNYGPARI